MTTPANYKQVITRFGEAPDEVKDYFPSFEQLVQGFEWSVSMGYVFSRIEYAKRMTLYCGLRKLWRISSEQAWDFVTAEYLTRKRFLKLFEIVFELTPPKATLQKLSDAEAVRDKLMHGHAWAQADVRKAFALIFDFATEFNDIVSARAGFRPFGKLRGFAGAGQPLADRIGRMVIDGVKAAARGSD